MFSAHTTTDPGIIFSPKATKKHTSELTLKIDNLQPRQNKQTDKKRLPTGYPNPLKIVKIQPWSPSCPLWCSCRPLNHQLVIKGPKSNSPMYQNRSSKFKKVIHIRN